MKKEEFVRKSIEKMLRNLVEQVLTSKEYAKKYYERPDKEDIEKNIDEIVRKVSKLVVEKLKERGFLDDKEPTRQEFSEIIRSSLDEILREKDESENNSKPETD